MNSFTQSAGSCPNTTEPETSSEGVRASDGRVQSGDRVCARPAAGDAPRRVTRGESFAENPESGESFEIFATGHNGKYRIISTPIAKPDGEPLAALTDYLNTTFPFVPTQENIVQLVRYFTEFLGVPFGSLTHAYSGPS